jgi:hypothetical protein
MFLPSQRLLRWALLYIIGENLSRADENDSGNRFYTENLTEGQVQKEPALSAHFNWLSSTFKPDPAEE